MDSRNRTETKTLKVGDAAPDFTLTTADRQQWHLSDFRGKKNVVLAFVPFAFSKVCSAQLPSYEEENFLPPIRTGYLSYLKHL